MSTSMNQPSTSSQTTGGAGSGQNQMSSASKEQREGGGMPSPSGSHAEGSVARAIEQQTAKLPSDTFLWAAVGSIGASALLRMMGKKQASLFVGDWVAPMLLFGVYNKIVKLHGSDRMDSQHGH